ncbi:exonuclease [Halobacteriales archaeon QS_8_69_26]|nr:MAG: exonuclease [Halobacteriales archaeon QS_8_69_26]
MRVENSFIPVRGVGEVTEKKLWRSGVTAWEEFDGSVVGPTLADRIESFVDEARDRLRAGDATYFDREFPGGERWRLYENFRDEACFFDIETTGLSKYRDEVTTVSLHRDGETTTLVRGRDLTAERLRREFADASLLVSFNGARFDVPFLEANYDLTVETPHLDVMYPCKKAGFSGGLGEVERALGIDRARPDISGEDAVRLWYQYERGGDRDALETLVSYNREDAENLRPVADAVTGILHDEVFETVRDD